MSLRRSRFNSDRDTGVAHHPGHLVDLLNTGQKIDVGDFVSVGNRRYAAADSRIDIRGQKDLAA